MSPNFHHVFILPQPNLWQNMNLFYLHLAFLSKDDRCPHNLFAGARAWPFQFDLNFLSKILANLSNLQPDQTK